MNFQFAFQFDLIFFKLISDSIFLHRNFIYHDIRHNLIVFSAAVDIRPSFWCTVTLSSSRKSLLKIVKFESNFQQKCKQAVCGCISISVLQKEVLVAKALYFDTSKELELIIFL